MAKKLPKVSQPIKLSKLLAPYFNALGSVVYWHPALNRELDSAIFYLSQSHSTWTIMHQISNTEAKIDLFSQMSHMRFKDGRTVKRIKALVIAMDAVNGQRNDVIHGRFLGVGRLGAQFMRMKPRSDKLGHKIINLKPLQIHAIARKMFALVNRLRKFDLHVLKVNAAAEAKRRSSQKK